MYVARWLFVFHDAAGTFMPVERAPAWSGNAGRPSHADASLHHLKSEIKSSEAWPGGVFHEPRTSAGTLARPWRRVGAELGRREELDPNRPMPDVEQGRGILP